VKAVFDTNILIDYLNGVDETRKELALYDEPAISVVTWMEVLVGADSDGEKEVVRGFLNRFAVIALTSEVAEKAVELRKAHCMRLPDAIIWASALTQSCLLVSKNTRDFPVHHPSLRVPYRL